MIPSGMNRKRGSKSHQDGDVCHCKKSSTTITTLWTARLKENDSMCDGRGTHNLIISSVSVPNCSNNILAESNRKENHENISENSTFTLDCKAKKENLVVNSSNEPEVKTGSSKLKEFDISSSGFRGCKQFPRSCDNEFNNSKITLFNDSTVTNGCGGLDGSHSDAVKIRKESDVRVKHISFDCPNTNKREYALKPCPSLDSSFAHSSIHLKEKNVGVYCKNSPFLDPCGFQPLSQPCPPYTPSTPASGLTSEASFDSGVISSHSFEFPQNVAVDVSDKRKRTASSVSSGIGDIWQSSLDGDICRENSMDVAPFDKNATPLSSSQSINGNNCSTKCKNSVFEATCENPDDNDGEIRKHEVNFPLGVKPSGALHSAHSSQTDHFNVLSESASDSHNASPLSVIFPVASEENLVPAVTAALDDTTKLASPRRSSTKSKGGMIEGGSLSAPRTVSSSFELKEKLDKFAMNLVMIVLNEAFTQSSSLGWSIKCSGQCNQELCKEDYKKKNSHRRRREKEIEKSLFSTLGFSSCSSSLCWTPELPFSPSHRTYSRASKRSSLSFSHDSLVVCTPCQDDSHLIKGAVSHDVLVFPTIKKAEIKKGKGAVCLEDDIYSLPVDVVKPYQGPILQPKVIVHQPKTRHSNRTISKKIDGQEAEQAVVTKRNINNNNSINNNNNNFKERGTRYTKQKGKTGNPNDDCSTNKRNSSLIPVENSHESIDDIEATTTIKESFTTTKPLERTKNRYRKEVKCYEQGKLCRIIPFTSTKGQKRKDNSDMKSDKKKTRSLSSNIRNTLVTFFSFKKSQKEPSNFINAENEFIDASAQELFESTDGMKWGKICPLPSAPPLKTSLKYSAFTDKIESVKAQSTTSKQPNSIAKDSLAADSSKCVNGNPPHNITNQQRQSNSISPSSLLSCLGHPRTNSIGENEHRQRTRRTSEEAKVSALSTVTKRALPPLPQAKGKWEVPVGEPKGPDWKPHLHNKLDEGCDFASIIEKVKNYGWYWGPISGLAAEKVLSNEPDGSFIVRDSSDYHYIFSLTFRLNGVTRHVRIEHDQGNFSFGGFTRFKSQTIVDFIEKAVEHSRSGRYLFFLHRRPVLGPMRVQLLHPVSRFKHVQSLQHLCRFVIVKQVRKDLLHDLPLPQRLKDYLNSPHYYSEQVEQCMSSSAVSLEGATANEDVHQNLSPFLRRHSPPSLQTHRRNTSSLTSTESSHGGCSNHVSLQEPVLAVKPTNSKFSFGDPSTSFVLPKCYKSRENRLSSSHSSLENSLLQMYPISPSTISSESNSGRRPRSRSRNAAFSLRPKAAFFYGSSHSSPSSPVPFDYSPDWLSSSDDFPFLAAASKPLEEQNLGASAHPQHISIKFPSENEQLKNCGTQRSCGLSASSTSQCVSDAFTVDECRHIPNNQVLQSPSTNDVDDGVKILGAQSTALCPELKCESSEELCRSSSSLVHKPNSN